MRHVYRCPVRWADLDQLGHVNNATWLDYLQEARVDMMRYHAASESSEALAEGVVVVGHRVSYTAPREFTFVPVTIESWVTQIRAASFTLAYEAYDVVDGERRTYLRASTILTPFHFVEERPRRLHPEEKEALSAYLEPAAAPGRAAWGPRPSTAWRSDVSVRFSDIDIYRHANNVVYFAYLQEARIDMLAQLTGWMPGGPSPVLVTAQADIDYRASLTLRPAPYDAWSWVSAVGRTSFTVGAEVADGAATMARASVVLVSFDPLTGRAVPPPADFHRALVESARG